MEAARLMEGIGEGEHPGAETTKAQEERRTQTEAWIREDEVAPTVEGKVVPTGTAEATQAPRPKEPRPSKGSTEAYLRDADRPVRLPGQYRFTSKDLRYAEEEVFVPGFRKAMGRAATDIETAKGEAVVESGPVSTPLDRPGPSIRKTAVPPVPPPQAVPSRDLFTAPPKGPSRAREAGIIEDEGPAQIVRREVGGSSGQTESRLKDEPVETPPGPKAFVDEPFKTLDAEPAFDRFSWAGPEFGTPSGGATSTPESGPHLGPPPPVAQGATRKESFSFPDLDMVPGSRTATGEEMGGHAGGVEPGSLDLSFDELSLPELEAERKSPVDELDIESVLKEESEPEAAILWNGEENAREATTERPISASGRIEGGPEGGLGLPDQWLDLSGAEGDRTPPGDLPGLDLEGFPGGSGGTGPEAAPSFGIREPPVVPALEPAVSARPPKGEVRAIPRGRTGATGLRLALIGTFLVALVGVLLGQTQYGYFGFNLFVPSDETLQTGRRAIPPPGATVGIAKDTPEAYQDEIVRLEALLRDDPDNARAKADLLEVMMRFRERFPAIVALDEKMERRLKQLEREAEVTGQKASLVRVLDLVNAGQFAEARAVLDGMVVATAQDADVLYFYGKIALGQEKYEEAQKYFELALLKNPASIAAKYFLAKTRIARGEAGEGRKLLEEILIQEPGHLASKVLLAQIALGNKENEAAARLAQEVVLKADSQAYGDELFGAHLVLAGVHEAAGNNAERVSELRAALALRPTHQETAVVLARLFLADGKEDDAVSVLEPCWKEGCDSLPFLTTYLEAVLATGQEQRAAEVMSRGAEKHPKSPEFAIIQGRYFLGLDRPRAAATAFEAAIALAPDATEAYLLLAEALVKDGKVGEAIRRLGEGATRVKDRVPLLRKMASLYRDLRDFGAAEETLRQVLVINPSNVEVQEQLGLIVLALGRAEEAVAVLGALHARHALGREGVLGLARAFLMMRKPAKAREVLARIYGKGEDDPVVATEYGRALIEAGQVQEADEVLKKVLRDHPSFAPAHHAMGQVHSATGETKAAMEQYMRAVQLDPRETHYRLDLARALKNQGTEEAIRDAMTHLDHVVNAYERGDVPAEDRQADAYVLRGEIRFSQQKYTLAMKDFEAALALDPARLDILVGFGRSLYQLARYDEAAAYFRQVLARDRTSPDANFHLGQILLRNGDVEGAKALFERVAQRNPDRYPEALRLLGMIYRDQNLKPLARKSFAAYLQHAPKGTAEAEEVRRILERMR